MIQEISKGRFPESPRNPYNEELCTKDFFTFKEKTGTFTMEYLNMLVKEAEKRGINPEIYKLHKKQLEDVKKLIAEHKEKAAFDQFFRNFPACLPYRSEFKPR